MKKIVILGIGASMFFLGSCVESSQKYKSLQSQMDSLQVAYNAQSTEMEGLFADLNDISAGMQSIREAEKLLTIESGEKTNNKTKKQVAQLKSDIQAVSEAIENYKTQIQKLDASLLNLKN